MKSCPYCGQENSEENRFCLSCGKDIGYISQSENTNSASEDNAGQSSQTDYQQMYMSSVPTVKKKIKWWNILGLLSGVAASGFGIFVLNKRPLGYISSYTYGADFYTYTSEQLHGIGEYLKSIFEVISVGFGCLLIAFGLFMIWHFTGKLLDK